MKFFPKKQKPKIALNAINRPHESVEIISDDELFSCIGSEIVFDIECYINYFLVSFKFIESGKVCYFEKSPVSNIDAQKLNWIVWAFCLIGFNSRNYDIPLLILSSTGASTELLKQCSDDIILNNLNVRAIEQKYHIRIPNKINHIDLQEVAPLSESLKKYAARMHAKRLQELPYDPHKVLTQEEASNVKDYNLNADLPATILLRLELDEQIKLRESIGLEYNMDLRSKSDAQIAEAVIGSEIRKITGKKIVKEQLPEGWAFKYKAPNFIKFQSRELTNLLAEIEQSTFTISDDGKPKNPIIAKRKVIIGSKPYTIGLGGLHSNEYCTTRRASESVKLSDIDFTSFYPKMILINKWFPRLLGPSTLIVLEKLVDKRIMAKKTAKTIPADKVIADSIKITINGFFGKLGSMFSIFYSPDLMIQVTLTGQLIQLMAIEAFESENISVYSANTDGIIIGCPQERTALAHAIISWLEKTTSLQTEEIEYKSIHSRDVNSYVAITSKGEVKVKGAYSERGSAGDSRLSKDPTALICNDAAIAYLTKCILIEETIKKCRDFSRFVVVRAAKGGAQKNSIYLGKVVRWYYAKNESGAICYANSGNKVANSEGGKPCMDLSPIFPDDIDYDVYIAKAYDILYDTGTIKRPGELF